MVRETVRCLQSVGTVPPVTASEPPGRTLADWAILCMVAEGPTHGWAVARVLAADGPLGSVWTVPRAVVYRSLATLAASGTVEPTGEERGSRGPNRTIVRVTARGRAAARRWLDAPVVHVRDVRSEFLLKLALLERSGRSREALVARQLAAFAPLFASVRSAEPSEGFDAVHERWRREQVAAVERFLRSLSPGGP